MKTILFVHQSAELYGSDKTLLLLIKNLDKTKFKSVVLLPFNGPLKDALEMEQIDVIIAPVLKLYRNIFTPKNIVRFFKDKSSAYNIVNTLHKEHEFDLIYSNTLAVLFGILFAWKNNIKHLWHVHEIIEKPVIFKNSFLFLLALKANTYVVYNSIATQNFWNSNKKLKSKSNVIWNGLELNNFFFTSNEILEIKTNIFKIQAEEISIALVGRISRWKGQLLLLEAFNLLTQTNSNIKLLFVGEPPPNQEFFQETLENKIKEYSLEHKVEIIPFQKNIEAIWEAIDIAIVPSTEPEPFGMVAIEAMLAKKPVVAANHGGLSEIVVQEQTGFLVEPNNLKELTHKIQLLIENKKLRKIMGEKGYERVVEKFSVSSYVNSFEKLFQKL